jgi:hypothetical protein
MFSVCVCARAHVCVCVCACARTCVCFFPRDQSSWGMKLTTSLHVLFRLRMRGTVFPLTTTYFCSQPQSHWLPSSSSMAVSFSRRTLLCETSEWWTTCALVFHYYQLCSQFHSPFPSSLLCFLFTCYFPCFTSHFVVLVFLPFIHLIPPVPATNSMTLYQKHIWGCIIIIR